MNSPDLIAAFWQAYLNTLPAGAPRPAQPEAWHFCDNQKDADELAQLTLSGTKQATCSAVWLYAVEGEKIPEPGDYSIIINWAQEPVCIIQSYQIDICPFSEVTEDFANTEGEGDGSLAYWRRAHINFFGRECAAHGKVFSEEMMVVCERFHTVFPV